MTDVVSLIAEKRERTGTGGARETRRSGRVPAIIYGDKKKPLAVSVDPVELQKQLRGPGFFARVFEIKVDGRKHRVLARDLQVDPVLGKPIHVDFMRFGAATKVTVEVEVVFENEEECPGIKKGGVLNIARHAIELLCKADEIPESISIDLSGLEIGEVIHIGQVKIPAEAELTITDRDFTVASIAAPTVTPAEEEEEAAAEEAEAAEERAEAGEEAGAEGEPGKPEKKESPEAE